MPLLTDVTKTKIGEYTSIFLKSIPLMLSLDE